MSSEGIPCYLEFSLMRPCSCSFTALSVVHIYVCYGLFVCAAHIHAEWFVCIPTSYVLQRQKSCSNPKNVKS
jgi:hypothetical protein